LETGWSKAGESLIGGHDGEQHLGKEEVDEDDEHGRPYDGLNGGAAHALGAAGGSHAVEAADGAEDVAEEERLDQALDDVGIAEELPGLVQVLGAVLVVHENGDQASPAMPQASETMVRKKSVKMVAAMRG